MRVRGLFAARVDVFACLILSAGCGSSPEHLTVLSGGAAQPVLEMLGPKFQHDTGVRIDMTFSVVGAIPGLVTAGNDDLLIAPTAVIDQVDGTTFHAAGRTVIGHVPVGVVVRSGAAAPDITSADSVRQMLLNATSIAIPDPAQTPTGKFLMGMFTSLGISATVVPKTTLKNAIDGGIDLVRDGQVQIGMYLVSEILEEQNITFVGKLPTQGNVVYGSAVSADRSPATQSNATRFVEFLNQPGNASVWTTAGFEATAM